MLVFYGSYYELDNSGNHVRQIANVAIFVPIFL